MKNRAAIGALVLVLAAQAAATFALIAALSSCGNGTGNVNENVSVNENDTVHVHEHVLVPGSEPAISDPGSRIADPEIFTNTDYVEDLLYARDALWVATRGGLEEYPAGSPPRRRLYGITDGLAATAVRAVALVNEHIVARTDRASCTLGDDSRFTCVMAPALPAPEPSRAPRFHDFRVTDRITIAATEKPVTFVGTAGGGAWIDAAAPVRLTPTDSICSNHITSMAEHAGRIWFGAFDGGLCSMDAGSAGSHGFRRSTTPFRMVNDLLSTPIGLYVAASEGLFLTADGVSFTKVDFVDSKGVNDLAFDGKHVYATTPATLYRIRVPGLGGKRSRSWFRPAGSRALQAVDVAGDTIWLASEDLGAISFDADDVTAKGATIYDKTAGLPSSWVIDVAALPKGGALLATLRDGLVRVKRDGTSSTIAGLPDAWMLHVSSDGVGGWLVGAQGGAARLDAKLTVTETFTDLPGANVHALTVIDGRTWIATEDGVLQTAGRRVQVVAGAAHVPVEVDHAPIGRDPAR